MIVRDLPLLGAPVNIGRPVLWFTVSRLVAKTLGAALPGQELNVSLTLPHSLVLERVLDRFLFARKIREIREGEKFRV